MTRDDLYIAYHQYNSNTPYFCNRTLKTLRMKISFITLIINLNLSNPNIPDKANRRYKLHNLNNLIVKFIVSLKSLTRFLLLKATPIMWKHNISQSLVTVINRRQNNNPYKPRNPNGRKNLNLPGKTLVTKFYSCQHCCAIYNNNVCWS